MIPDPRNWYIHDGPDDAPTVTIYDGADYPVLLVDGQEADEEVGLVGYTAKELALFLLTKVGAAEPIQ